MKDEGRRMKDEWSEWMSDIEGKATRVGVSELGKRTSFNYEVFARFRMVTKIAVSSSYSWRKGGNRGQL
jgi:hypothetical protein